MKRFLGIVMFFLSFLIGIIIGLSLEALLFWGIGNLILWLLNMDFNWTFIHGLVMAIILCVIRIEFKIGE